MPLQDFLDETASANDPYAAAQRYGASRADADMGIIAPTAARPRKLATPKPFNPLDDPRYKQAEAARKELHTNEALYHQRLRDFDATEGAPLKWKTTPGELPGDDPRAIANGRDQQALLDTVRNSPGSPENIAATRRMQLLAQKRQRLADEANRITHNRIQFDEQTFVPLRDQLMGGARNQAPAQPTYQASDYLAPSEDTPLNNRIADINARRQRLGQAPLAPGSVSAGNFTESWVPPEQRTQTPDQAETDSKEPLDLTPQNNPPGDETRYGGREADNGEPSPLRGTGGEWDAQQVPDALSEDDRNQRHLGMAEQFYRGLDRFNERFPSAFKQNLGEGVEGAPGIAKSWRAGEKPTVEIPHVPMPEVDVPLGNTGVSTADVTAAINKVADFASGLTSKNNAGLVGVLGILGKAKALGGAIGSAASKALAAAELKFAASGAEGAGAAAGKLSVTAGRDDNAPGETAGDITDLALNSGMAASLGVAGGRSALEAPGAPPPPFNDQGGRFRPIGPQPEGGASPGTGTMLRKILVDAGAFTSDDASKLSDLQAHEEVQKLAREHPSAVDIGPRDESISNGSGTATPAEADMIARWQQSILEEQQNAPKIESPAAVDVRNAPANGEALGGGDAIDQVAPRENQVVEETPSAGLPGRSGEPSVEPISSATQNTLENTGESSNESRQLGTGGEPQQPVIAEQPADVAEPNRHGENPDGRIEPSGSVRSGDLRPDRGSGGEQPRGGESDGAQLPGPGVGGALHADLGLAGDAGRPVTPAEPLSLESPTLEQQATEAQAARENAAAQEQRDALVAGAEKPLTGDSSNVGQGQLLDADADLFSGPSAETTARTGAAHEISAIEERAAREANAITENPPEVPAEEALPIPQGKSVRDVARMSSRIRAIDKELESAKGDDRAELLQERLQVGAEMGHDASARALERWHAADEQPGTMNDIVRSVVKRGGKGITTDKSHPLAGEIRLLREEGVPKRLFSPKGAGIDTIGEAIREQTDSVGLTNPKDPPLTESQTIDLIKQAFSEGAVKEPPKLNVPTIKLSRTDRVIAALENAKFHQPGRAAAGNPVTLAWDAAIDTAITGIKAGRAAAEIVRAAIDHFREKNPNATDEHVGALERTLNNLVGTLDRSRSGETGIKNASVDRELSQMGLPPATHGERLSFQEAADDAVAKIKADPHAGEKLLASLEEKSRPVTGAEDALLLHEQRRLKNARDAAESEFVKAAKDGDEAAMAEARGKIAKARDDYQRAADIVTRVGTESSLSLGHRRMMMKEDYSLAAMERAKIVANDGKPLTPEQESQIRDLHHKIAAAERAHAEHVSKLEEEKASLSADLAIRKIAQGVQKEGVKPADPGKVRKFIADRASEARARIEARLRSGKTLSGIDPTELADYAYIAAEYLARGVDAGAQLVKDFGDAIKPHIKAILEKAKTARDESETMVRTGRDIPGERKSTIETVRERLDDGESIGDLGAYVRKIAEQHVRDGITDREKLIDAVHATLKEADPEITRRETMDAISGYGQFKPLNPDAVKAQLRDLKGQMQQVGKLQDMQSGQAPAKTGVERRTPSDEERRLIKQVEEAKKKGGYTVTDPAKQLKSSLDAIKTRLNNSIKDLTFQISTGKKIVRDKTSPPRDAETETLVKKRDELRKQYGEIFKRPGLSDSQKIKAASKAVERSIADYEARINEGAYLTRTKAAKAPTSLALDALRARRDALKAQFESLQALERPERTQAEISLQAFKTRTANRIADLQEKLANQDFSPREPRAPIRLDEEGTRLKEQAMRAKQAFDEALIKDRLAKRSLPSKVADTLVRWRRGFLLSGPVTLGKLTAAAAQRLAFTPVEEAVGAGISKVLPRLAERAPRQGGSNVTAEAKAITEAFTKGLKDSADIMRTGKSQLEVLYGKGRDGAVRESDVVPHSVIDYFGQLHGALKAPVKRAEFTRSFEKRVAWNLKNGVDVSDPMVQMKIATQAYKDANASIFLQDNVVTNAWNRAVGALEAKNKETGEVSPAGKTLATAAKTFLPIVKVPTNIAAETFQHVFGTVTGSARLANAMRKGMDTLTPEQADLIMQSLKKGSLGAAALTLGYFASGNLGGYYQKGEKRKQGDLKPGNARIFGTDIPTWLLHNPLLETLQIGATIRRVAESKLKKTDANPQGLGSGAWAAALGLAEEVPFVRETIEGGKMAQDDRRAIGDQARGMLVPMAVQTAAGWMDKNATGETTSRKPRNVGESIEMGIPGLRQQVPLRSYVDPVLTKRLGESGVTVPDITRPRVGPPGKKVGVDDDKFLAFQKEVSADINDRLQRELPRLSAMPKERAQVLVDRIAEEAHVRARVQLELRERRGK